MSAPITILIADDHASFARTLASWLRSVPDLRVLGVVGRADEAIDRVLERKPDVLLLDIDMPGPSCFDAARIISERCPKCAVVFLSAYAQDRYIDQALEVKASGYVLKTEPPEAIAAAVRAVAAGEAYFSPEVQSRIVIDSEGAHLAHPLRSRLATLTARELETLRYIACGKAKKEIAQAMSVKLRTVNAHTMNLMDKLNIHDRVELTLFAIREGLAEA